MRWTFASLLLASALLTACAGGPKRASRGELRFDTETAARLRHATAVARDASALAPGSAQVVASHLLRAAPVLLTLLKSDDAVQDFDERLVECARPAEREVNSVFFGDRSPTREECGEEVEVDGCGEPVTQAMRLGQRKHVLALQCAREVLEQFWPGSFSLEQRYRYYPNARFLETVSQAEEARLIAQGCTRELWRTIKPDIVLHSNRDLLRSVLTLDFKFPCPDTNVPRWREYGADSAYAGSNQGRIYKQALEGPAAIISPLRGVVP